ncbi:MAG: hypothetical protein H8E12_06225 [Rhodobacteraceae bacterium]|nr:hypothetical protein [Paracoccaceae bacterium]
MYITIKNKGVIDIPLAVNLLGASIKDDTLDPIGMFGSGLKYSMAQCLRENIQLHLSSNGSTYALERDAVDFKGASITRGVLVDQDGIRHATPVTPEFGQHDWDETWFIFRELFSNALDECKDKSDALYSFSDCPVDAAPGETVISLERKPFEGLLLNFSSYFQIGREKFVEEGNGVVFKRGVRIGKVPGSKLNWGHPNISVNESRKMNEYSAYSRLADLIVKNTDPQPWILLLSSKEEFIDKVDINLTYELADIQVVASSALHQSLVTLHGANYVIAPKSIVALLDLATLGYSPVTLPSNWTIPKNCGPLRWWDSQGIAEVSPWRECTPEEDARVRWGLKLIKDYYGVRFSPEDVQVLESDHPIAGQADIQTGLIALDETVFDSSSQIFLHTLVHEIGHVKSGAGDGDRKFTNWFVDRLCENMLSV